MTRAYRLRSQQSAPGPIARVWEFDGGDPRRRVTQTSLLDVGCHWQAILVGLLRHNDSGLPTTCDPSEYCVVALTGDRPGHGVVLGDRSAIKRLVIVNWGDVHFDPCLPL